MKRRQTFEGIAVTRVLVEDAALSGGLEQRLVIVLTVYVDQAVAELAQHLQRDGPAVRVRSRSAVG